ncbi:hypothetical protein F4776DRAFT_633906 [Hypoxylon sp. NC0597]|nr:hypothetical protein F4776DRAFT_633906 [Hypoxylon sp. NC0597]
MCTGVCWNLRCYQCEGIVMKDTKISGHNCHEARRKGKRGCCKTGVELTFYDRIVRELCIACELRFQISKLDAETCDEAMSETRIGYHRESDDCLKAMLNGQSKLLVIHDNEGHDSKDKRQDTENEEYNPEIEVYNPRNDEHDPKNDEQDLKNEHEELDDSESSEDLMDTDDDEYSDDEEGGVSLTEESEDGTYQVETVKRDCTLRIKESPLWQRRYNRFFTSIMTAYVADALVSKLPGSNCYSILVARA